MLPVCRTGMSRKHKRSADPKPLVSADRADVPPAVRAGLAETSQISRLIEKGEFKLAVERAKALHKASPSLETESLVAEAYIARARSFGNGMGAEASALLDLVVHRCPSARARVEEVRPLVGVRTGQLDAVVGRLTDPALPPERKRAIENAIRTELTDLHALAETSALPEGHLLRTAAAAIIQAFTAATTRSVSEDEIALAGVTHRSPLAPWKLLVRALACFYRRDDDGCARSVEGIDSTSAPYRLVAPLKALMSPGRTGGNGALPSSAGPRVKHLLERVSAREDLLEQKLQALDRVLAQRKPGKVLALVRDAMDQCRASRPELVERLKQHIAVRCMVADVAVERVRSALGPPRRDAYLHRLMAKAFETRHEVPMALAAWADFEREAVAESWFRGDGPEAAALYLHMLDVLLSMGEDDVRAFTRSKRAAEGDREKAYCLFPERLFEKACACDPRSETFQRWLEWTRKDRNPKASENVALQWHLACPGDARPLLYLTEVTEKRNALKKALGFLEKAELLDALNPEVKRARLRLVVATAMRHVKERKVHLVERDLAELEALPQVQQGRRRAIVPALRAVCTSLGSGAGDRNWTEAVASELESTLGAAVFVQGLARACNLELKPNALSLLDDTPLQTPGVLAVAAARACALGEDFGFPVLVPPDWMRRLTQDLNAGAAALTPLEVSVLAEAALRQGARDLAYVASGVGLTEAHPSLPRFLTLRAQSLPYWEDERRRRCLIAARALARRQRDMELVGAIVETGRTLFGPFFEVEPGEEERTRVEEVLREEKAARNYPEAPPTRVRPATSAVCAHCGRRHADPEVDAGQYGLFSFEDDLEGDFEEADVDEDDDLIDDDDDMDADFDDMPPLLVALLMEVAAKHGGRTGGVPTPEVLERKDPKLYKRLRREMEKAGVLPTGAGNAWPDGPPRRRGKKAR